MNRCIVPDGWKDIRRGFRNDWWWYVTRFQVTPRVVHGFGQRTMRCKPDTTVARMDEYAKPGYVCLSIQRQFLTHMPRQEVEWRWRLHLRVLVRMGKCNGAIRRHPCRAGTRGGVMHGCERTNPGQSHHFSLHELRDGTYDGLVMFGRCAHIPEDRGSVVTTATGDRRSRMFPPGGSQARIPAPKQDAADATQ